jgi:hypothetical protein
MAHAWVSISYLETDDYLRLVETRAAGKARAPDRDD